MRRPQFIRKDPLGVVLVAAAWNYPYLIAVNSVVPAILAGMGRQLNIRGERARKWDQTRMYSLMFGKLG